MVNTSYIAFVQEFSKFPHKFPFSENVKSVFLKFSQKIQIYGKLLWFSFPFSNLHVTNSIKKLKSYVKLFIA